MESNNSNEENEKQESGQMSIVSLSEITNMPTPINKKDSISFS